MTGDRQLYAIAYMKSLCEFSQRLCCIYGLSEFVSAVGTERLVAFDGSAAVGAVSRLILTGVVIGSFVVGRHVLLRGHIVVRVIVVIGGSAVTLSVIGIIGSVGTAVIRLVVAVLFSFDMSVVAEREGCSHNQHQERQQHTEEEQQVAEIEAGDKDDEGADHRKTDKNGQDDVEYAVAYRA